MNTIISKWKDSLGIRIPIAVAKAAGIDMGSRVNITVIKGRIVVEPIKYNLKKLLSGITQKNRHPFINAG